MMSVSAIAFILAALYVAEAAVPADQITTLPGWTGALPSPQYSGYLSFNSEHLHYWLVLSENNPATDPIIVWFNGGPGCSSLEGYLYEHGPFHNIPSDPLNLYYNNYTWAQVASVLYIEAPAGVGFSYSDNKNDYHTDDDKTAADNLLALQAFFTSYPEYANNDLYITGESYAGIYVPTLAFKVYQSNLVGHTKINLKGIAVGNGCTGNAVGACAGGVIGTQIHFDYYVAHGLFSVVTYNKLLGACNYWQTPDTSDCLLALNDAASEIGSVNIYDIYAPCINGAETAVNKSTYSRTPYPRSPVGGPDECIDSIAASAYLNQPNVQAALHVKPAPSGNWSVCGNVIDYKSTVADEPSTIYPTLIENYRVLIFNGDVDGCVPYTDNEQWTSAMGYTIKDDWHPWMVGGQVAGYATVYLNHNFTFATVKGSGHMVPQYQPAAALSMITAFIHNESL